MNFDKEYAHWIFLFIIAGVIVLFNMQTKKIAMSKAVPLFLLSMIFGSFAAVSAKYIYTSTSFWNAFLLLRISGLSALFVLLVPKIRNDFVKTFKSMPSNYRKIMCSKMVVDFSAFIFSGYAVTMGPVSIISALSNAVMPIMVFLIALFITMFYPMIMKENVSKGAHHKGNLNNICCFWSYNHQYLTAQSLYMV